MQSIKAKAYSLLAKRSYFAKELKQKLLEKGYKPADIDSLISELIKQGWLNDEELASRFVKREGEKGYGARVILQKLRAKAGELSVDIAGGDIHSLIEKKYIHKLPQEREKVIAALLRRGFSYDLILQALAKQEEK